MLRANVAEVLLEELARLVVFSAEVGAAVEIHIVLPAVPAKKDGGQIIAAGTFSKLALSLRKSIEIFQISLKNGSWKQ